MAIDANPRYIRVPYLDAFDRQEGLGHVTNWLYLTGTLPQFEGVWRELVRAIYQPGSAMIHHSEFAYVIDADGQGDTPSIQPGSVNRSDPVIVLCHFGPRAQDR